MIRKFSNFYGYGFGGLDPSLLHYQSVVVPDSIKNFVPQNTAVNFCFKFSDPRFSVNTIAPCNQAAAADQAYNAAHAPWVTDPAGTGAYESLMLNNIQKVFAAFKGADPSDQSGWSQASQFLSDLQYFRDYYTGKLAGTISNAYGSGTLAAKMFFTNTYFGDSFSYDAFIDWLTKQQSNYVHAQLNLSQQKLSASATVQNQARIDFFNNTLFPLSDKFSSSDIMFLGEVFLLNAFGSVRLVDLIKAIRMISPYLSAADLQKIIFFADPLILGVNALEVINYDGWPNGTVNSSGVTTYPPIDTQDYQIKSKFSKIMDSFGSYLPKDASALFDERIACLHSGDMVCPSGSQLIEELHKAVQDAIMSVSNLVAGAKNLDFSLTQGYSQSQEIQTAGQSVATQTDAISKALSSGKGVNTVTSSLPSTTDQTVKTESSTLGMVATVLGGVLFSYWVLNKISK